MHPRSALRAVLLVVGFAAVACGRSAPEIAAPPRIPGVVLLCIDTLRHDALGAPGTSGGRLPTLRTIAAQGVSFDDATAPAPWTGPSVASLLTGLLPSRHGLGVGFDEAQGRALPRSLTTLAESLQGQGWFTSALTGGVWVTPTQGFGQGFDHFAVDFDLRDPVHYLAEWEARRPKDRPFLLFLHTFAAHEPYGDKQPWVDGLCGDRKDARLLADRAAAFLDRGERVPDPLFGETVRLRWTDPCGRVAFENRLGVERVRSLLSGAMAWAQSDWRADPAAGDVLAASLRTAYQEGLDHVERRLSRTFDGLGRLGLPPETAVVVLGDHGEAFGEGGELHHGQALNDAVIRVPLIVSAPGRLPANVVVRGGCGVIDVMPTILDLAGAPAPKAIDGRSLLSFARGQAGGAPMVSEGQRAPAHGRGAVGILSVRVPTAKWLLEYDIASGEVLLDVIYDLAADPSERATIAPAAAWAREPDLCRAVGVARNDLLGSYGRPSLGTACRVHD